MYRHAKTVAVAASKWSLQYHWLAGMKTESGLSLYMTAGVDNTNDVLTYLYNVVLFATFSGLNFYINNTFLSARSVFPQNNSVSSFLTVLHVFSTFLLLIK